MSDDADAVDWAATDPEYAQWLRDHPHRCVFCGRTVPVRDTEPHPDGWGSCWFEEGPSCKYCPECATRTMTFGEALALAQSDSRGLT